MKKRIVLSINKNGKISLTAPKQRRRIYKPPFKIYDLTWEFHKGDVDFFPSVPHGHSGKYKLDVVNGDVYEKDKKQPIGKIKEKEFDKLKKDKRFIEFAKEVIKWYKKEYPERNIKTPDWVTDKANNSVTTSGFRAYLLAPGYEPNQTYSTKLKTEIYK